MREILFRGKRESDGKWLYGLYADDTVCGTDFPCIMPLRLNECDDEGEADGDWAVLKETVGQYTGLTDRNGTKIFEGDIVEFRRFKDTCASKIIFNHKTAGFEFWWNVVVGAYGEKATHQANMSVSHEINVIGNIYDNPELLKS